MFDACWEEAMNNYTTGYGDGWDSLEGAILKHLGIKDTACNGVENIIKDLVKKCDGFKEWRKLYRHHNPELKRR